MSVVRVRRNKQRFGVDISGFFSASNPTVSEGNSGTTPATAVLTASKTFFYNVIADWFTRQGSGNATPNVDFQSNGGTVQIAAGQTQAQAQVNVVGDTDQESNETFEVVFRDVRRAP